MVNNHIRSSKDFKKVIDDIRMEFIKKGKAPPSVKDITQVISKKVKKEDILYDDFIRF